MLMIQEIAITIGLLFLFHVTLYYTNTDLMKWIQADPSHYLFPEESNELKELKEQLEKKINEYKHA